MEEERKTTERTILCSCGHPLSHHSLGAGECYVSTRRKERRKDYTGKYVIVKCVYSCVCKKFELEGEKTK